MVLSNGMLVNNETKSYETYSSSSGNGGKRFVISPLMVYLFLQCGRKQSEMTLAALYSSYLFDLLLVVTLSH